VTQDGFFDAAGGMAQRDEGMARAERGTPDAWRLLAEDSARWCARMRPTFTTDDVWARMVSQDPEGAKVREPRALGAIMSKLHRDGVLAPTGEYVPSARPSAHRNPKREWRINR
jgi:hypothetical protein